MYDFVTDRMRSILMDATLQGLTGCDAVRLHEQAHLAVQRAAQHVAVWYAPRHVAMRHATWHAGARAGLGRRLRHAARCVSYDVARRMVQRHVPGCVLH
jgi:hypothetical protein